MCSKNIKTFQNDHCMVSTKSATGHLQYIKCCLFCKSRKNYGWCCVVARELEKIYSSFLLAEVRSKVGITCPISMQMDALKSFWNVRLCIDLVVLAKKIVTELSAFDASMRTSTLLFFLLWSDISMIKFNNPPKKSTLFEDQIFQIKI